MRPADLGKKIDFLIATRAAAATRKRLMRGRVPAQATAGTAASRELQDE
jgi:hypothetical protein